jgi:Zn-dependent protease
MDLQSIAEIALLIVPIVIAITFHEAAHGYVALMCGDRTAKEQGRVTLNPLKHIDPVGTVIMPLLLYLTTGFMFGFAKPVPVNFNALRHPRRDMVLVAAAGPGMNILLAFGFALALTLYLQATMTPESFLTDVLARATYLNVVLAVFNLIPLPPLDGSKVVAPFLPWPIARSYLSLERYGTLILLVLLIGVPMIAERSGSDFDPFRWLIGIPANALTRFILSITGLV